MHLTYSNSKYKGKIYKSYSVAESYREGTNVRKRILWSIGKLSDLQAEQIRQICKIVKNPKQLFIRLKDVVVQESRAYLDLAVVNEVWNQWELDKAFDYDVTGGPLPTRNVAKILTINRCTDPCSHYSVPRWARRNALEEVIKSDLSGLNDDKIYYELDKIQKNKISIENHIFKQTFNKHPESYGFINYDLTTTYFIGYKCDLSSFGKGKIECHGRRQILLGVLINSEGYPFKWDVFPGKTAEVKTLKQNINACKTRFKLKDKNVTICILAYFINRYLSNKRKLAGGKDFLNSKELYAPFKDIDITTLEVKGTGETVKKAVTLPPATQMLLKEIGMSHIVLTS